SQNLSNISFNNCYSDYAGHFIKDAQSSTYSITGVSLERILANNNRNIGIYMTDFISDISLNNVWINYTPNHAGLYVANCNGMEIADFDVAFGYGIQGASGGHGAVFNNCHNVSIKRAMVDYISGIPLIISNCSNFTITDWVSSLYTSYGFFFEKFSDSNVSSIKANGAYNSSYGIFLSGCSRLTMDNVIIQDNKTGSIQLLNSTGILTKNLMVCNNTGNGYIETGVSNSNVLLGGEFYNNSGSDIIQNGSVSKFSGVIVNNTFYDVRTGSITIN
ncbi:MAG: NosD domain-containing protein, partial [Saccharofermentanales bacterium]